MERRQEQKENEFISDKKNDKMGLLTVIAAFGMSMYLLGRKAGQRIGFSRGYIVKDRMNEMDKSKNHDL